MRIIPARAGFTWAVDWDGECAPDHPRSRGVYCARGPSDIPPQGSSPLARGLRVLGAGYCECEGIIPARAGFTGLRRGVDVERGGSSPLARGLRKTGDAKYKYTRIIPARAGFTRVTMAGLAVAADHPRSRGVYRR